ncbi:MAG TPA: aminotransferase class I/II-fold pyridoxal phosphate-dependent enzyme [Saprospiraceae bacterium]|nr:aminotransferase class I/II-fold pyridoxal phosphate-dependent enzyme [Saprospiraceae bacterium]HMQ85300.1 aminotransferase class I/II-fold pyridoxal phosphate-dependent enzyme [Saprospiraceae bacterium]
MDLFEKFKQYRGPLGQYADIAHGYFAFPKLEGEVGSRMMFRGKEVIVWNINSYLGLANDPEIRKTDAEAAADWGMAYPMGARIMSGESVYHEQLEQELATFVGKERGLLLNFGFQGVVSLIDSLLSRHDAVVFDKDSHACIYDGVRLHLGKRFPYDHNDMESLDRQLQRATASVAETGGGILVITEGVFGMQGEQGKLKEIAAFKDKYDFRLLVDDAHGFGTLGATGAGAGEEQGVQDQIDLYFSTFAKSMASIGAFVAGDPSVIDYLRYNMRSQLFAKTLPMPIVIGNLKRLEMLRTRPELKEKLWRNVNMLQSGLRAAGFDLGKTSSCVTPVFMKGSPFEAGNLVMDMRENYNIFCSVVMYPMVPKDVILLRMIPTAAHSEEDVRLTIEAFSALSGKLKAGEYEKEIDVSVFA